jgi:hypothetical protein
MTDAVPPWEGDGPLVRRWLKTAVALQTRPDATYAAMADARPPGAALGFSALGLGVWQLVGSAPWILFALAALAFSPSGSVGIAYVPVLFLSWLLYGLLFWVVGGTFLTVAAHLMLAITGGTAGGLGQTVRAVAYGFGSATPVLALPYLGWLLFPILGTTSATFGLGAIQRAGVGRALLALLLPAFVCGGGGVAWFAYLLSTVNFH